MASAWELDIPSTEKMVLLCLCDFSGDEGVCWPSVPTIARSAARASAPSKCDPVASQRGLLQLG
jgi:hypothetical protein